jgi:membrane protease YdiL (CAAX protease family)
MPKEMRFLWVVLAYLGVFWGMFILRNAWGALIGFHLTLLPLIVIDRQKIISRLRTPVSLGILLAIAASGIVGGAGLWLTWPHAGLPNDFSSSVGALGLSGNIWLPFILYFVLVNPVLEEAYWRSALTNSSRYPALVDFLFAGYHLFIIAPYVGLFWMLYVFIILACASWFWREVTRYTGSLLPAIFSHMLADLTILLVIYSKS